MSEPDEATKALIDQARSRGESVRADLRCSCGATLVVGGDPDEVQGKLEEFVSKGHKSHRISLRAARVEDANEGGRE